MDLKQTGNARSVELGSTPKARVMSVAEPKISIVKQYHGVRRETSIPEKGMKTFRVEGITFGVSVGQTHYWDEEQEKWRYTKALHRPELFVLDAWGQYSYLAPLDMYVPFNDWPLLTSDDGDAMLVRVVTEGMFCGKTILEFLKNHELTGKGGFL